jgi:hypothetical protein
MRIAAFTALLGLGLAPALAAAEDDAAAMSCARFTTLGVTEQVTALSTLEPLGDEINASDAAASRDWAAAVAAVCHDRPETLLPEAARDALGE